MKECYWHSPFFILYSMVKSNEYNIVKIEELNVLQIPYIRKRRKIKRKINLRAKKTKNTYQQQKWDHVFADLKIENWNKLENNKNEENDIHKTYEYVRMELDSLIGWEKCYWSIFNSSLAFLAYM